jgi:SAM-dependent methyltransferase
VGDTGCVVCGGSTAPVFSVTTDRAYEYRRCGAGHGVYAYPRPTPEQLDDLYSERYFHSDDQFGYQDYGWGQVNAERMWTALGLWCPFPLDPGAQRLLDVGCASGEFAAAAGRAGWEAWGIEPTPSAAAATAKGVRVVGGLDDPGLEAASFGLVTAFDIIEHLPQPMDLLTGARRLVAPDGYLVVETPNWASVGRRVKGGRWAQVRPPEHINFFDPAALTALVRRAGFEPVLTDTPHEGSINAAVLSLYRGPWHRAVAQATVGRALQLARSGGKLRILARPTA